MSSKTKTAGKCLSCEAEFAKGPMARHLERCAYPHAKDVVAVTRLRVEAPGSPFWVDLDVKTTATMRQLDEFLREIWLDCCGHLSAFDIGELRYVVSTPDAAHPHEQTMKTKVSAALPEPGNAFRYEYDHGQPTELRLEVVEQRHAPARRDAVRLLARNEAPVWKCTTCTKSAQSVCASCKGFLCAAHIQKHKCGATTLPVTNSPRMGVCGYAG
jgi:hypothetical protein